MDFDQAGTKKISTAVFCKSEKLKLDFIFLFCLDNDLSGKTDGILNLYFNQIISDKSNSGSAVFFKIVWFSL